MDQHAPDEQDERHRGKPPRRVHSIRQRVIGSCAEMNVLLEGAVPASSPAAADLQSSTLETRVSRESVQSKGRNMYIGIGTLLVIVVIVVLVMAMRR